MKVAQRLLAVLLALVMVFGLLPTSFRPTKAEADECEWNTEDADVLWAEINALEDELYAKRAPATSVVQKVADLVTADEHYVEDSIIWRGDGFFFWETTDGTINGYSSRLRQKLRNSDAVIAETVEDPGEIETVSFANSATRSGSPSSKNVLVVQPYYGIDSSFTTQYKTEGESIAAALGGTCTTLLTTNATVTNIASYMQNAAVTIFDSHGDTDYANGEDYTSRANTSYLCLQSGTGLTTADQKAVSGTFGTYYHAYYAGANGSMKYYCVDGTAITNHMTSSMPNSMVWMAICLGMATSGLNAPFLSHGADVVYGYSQSVTFDGDYAYEEYFWDKMKSGSNVKTTIANMKSSLGYWDPAYSSYSYTNARNNYCAFPIVASSEDTYPGHGNVDTYQTVNSTWTLLGGSSSTTTTAPSSGSGEYTLVTSASNLKAGDIVIIVAKDHNYALSTTQNSNNRGQVAITKDGNTVSKVDGLQELTLESGTTSGTFAFHTGSGYLYAASSSSNHLKTKTALDANGSFNITISSGVASIVAQGTNTRNVMQYNQSSSLFACYASASQKDVAIYKKAGSSSATATATAKPTATATAKPTATTTTAPATTAPNTTPNPEAEGILIYLDDANTYYGSSGVEALEAILTSSSAESTLISINDSQHTSTTSYDNLRDYALACADRPGDTRLHTGYYRTLYTQYWAPITQGTTGSGAILNREHVIPQSVGGFDTSGPGSDVHHLRPEWADANSSRSNIPFGEVTSGTEYYSNYAGGLYAFLRSSSAVEPADHVKGDVARILMYMYIAYDDEGKYNVDPRSSTIFTSGTSTLIDWCMNDPVDVVELNRNNYGQYEQGNRNPFIDCPALSEVIFGSGRYGSTSWYTVTNEVGSYTQTYSGGDPVYTKSSSATYGGYLYVPSYSSRDSFTAVDNYAVPTVVSAGSSFNFTYEVQSSLPGSVAVVYTSTGATLPTSGSGAYYKWDSSTNTVSVYNVDGNITIKYVTGSSSATATPKPTATATPKPTATPTAKPTATATAKPTATATATTTTAPSTGSTTYTKVTTAPSDWSGEYLIVYEDGNLIFDGSLATLDAVNDYQSVTISNSQITTDSKYSFTIAKTSSGYSIRSASGKYIGQTSNANGLATSSSAYENTLSLNNDKTVNIVSGGAYLRFNAASNQMRFRYYQSTTYTGQKAICLYKASDSGSTATATPTETPAASGEYYVLTDSISGGGEYVIAAQYNGTWYAVSNNPYDTSSLVGGLLPVKMTLSGDILTLNDSSATAADIEWTCYGISTEGYTDYYALKSQDAEYLSYYNPNSGSYEWLSIHTTLTTSGCWQYSNSTKRLVNYSDSSYGISWDADRSSFDYYTDPLDVYVFEKVTGSTAPTATPTAKPTATPAPVEEDLYVLTDSIVAGEEYIIAYSDGTNLYAATGVVYNTSSNRHINYATITATEVTDGYTLRLTDTTNASALSDLHYLATASGENWTLKNVSNNKYLAYDSSGYVTMSSSVGSYGTWTWTANSSSTDGVLSNTNWTGDAYYYLCFSPDSGYITCSTQTQNIRLYQKVTGGTVTPTATPSTGDGTTVFTDIDTLLIYNPLIYYEGSSVVTNEVSTGNMSGQIKTSGVSNARSASTRTPSKTSEFLHLTPAQISDMLGMKHVGAADEVDTRAVTVGSSQKFWIQTDMDDESTYASTTMYARAVGDYCVVWGNSSFTSTSVASDMAAEFDDVIYSADIANFGSARFVEDGEKLNILVYPISTGGVGTILGYFWGVELYSSSDWSSGGYSSYASSYNKDSAIIHINADVCTSAYLESNVYPTIAHEFQHLINYTSALKNSNNDSMLEETTMNTWLNESMSMQAEELIYPGLVAEEGYISTSYNGSTDISGGQSLYCFDTNNDIGVYGQVFLWSEYMKEQAQNSGVFTKLHNHWRTCSASDLNDGAGILAALTAYNPTAVTNIWNGVSYSSDIISKINSTDNLSATSTNDATSDSVFLSKANLAFQIATYLQETEGIWSLGDACSDADPLLTKATTVSIDGGGRIWVKTADEYSYTVPSNASDYLIYVGFKNGEMVFGPTTAEDYQTTTPTCNHANTTTSTVDATCTQAGSTTVTCDDCGEVISTTTIPATGHTEGTAVQENVVAATCETAGSYDTVVYCTVCGKEVSRTTTTVPATGHTEVTTVTEATCTQNGQTVVSCSVCGKTLSTTVIPASGHDYQQSGTSTATCVVAGTTTYVCENCGDSYTETGAVNPNNHEHVVEDAAVAATCTETGLTEGSHCSDCGKVIVAQQTVPATGHTEGTAVKENVVAATCVVAGSYDTVVYCTVCGKEVSRTTTTVPATGHTEVTTVTEATCTQDGKTVVSCSVCGETLSTTVIPALGHDYAYTSNEDGTHNAVCTHNATHTIMNETCTMQAGTCIYCGYTDPETVVSTLKGDANCDGKVDAADVTLIALYLGGKASLTPQGKLNADMDENGILNLTDRRLIARLITGG